MTSHCLRSDEYELSRTSTYTSDEQDSCPARAYHDDDHDADLHDDHDHDHDLGRDGPHAHLLSGDPVSAAGKHSVSARISTFAPVWLRPYYRPRRPRRACGRAKRLTRSCAYSPRSLLRKFAVLCYLFFATILIIVVVGGIFFPGYTHLPPHYQALQERALAATAPGSVNPHQQKVFIAASIYDRGGRLSGGDWADNVLELIQLLGPENTFMSIFVNDAGPAAKDSLDALRQRVPCAHSLVFEEHLDFDHLPHFTAPDGTRRIKRIEYLAAVRNRALLPLDTADTVFDKLLYLNDVVFHPIDAAQLLFSTHTGADGRADYRAACAVDFINPFKFYDTFATRDVEGYSMGLPFFPWFSANGDEQSHQDVLDGKDAVRVRSCWGGMVAFDARFFQRRPDAASGELITAANQSPSNLTAPYKFRSEQDLFWDASECCLIQADIQNPDPGNTGIYMNPFVRVAYDSRTLSWLGFTRRFERLYTPIHFLLDILTNAPFYNPRRDEVAWQVVEENVWVPDARLANGGSFQDVTRVASHTGFCGRQSLQVIKANLADGERNWEFVPVPS